MSWKTLIPHLTPRQEGFLTLLFDLCARHRAYGVQAKSEGLDGEILRITIEVKIPDAPPSPET